MKLLIIRAKPAADRTARAVQSAGLTPIFMPLFEIASVDWEAPNPEDFAGLLMTSVNAVQYAGKNLTGLSSLPVLAVGSQTAHTASEAGLSVQIEGRKDKADILRQAKAAGYERLLWLSGKHGTDDTKYDGIIAKRLVVYENRKLPEPPDFSEKLENADIVLLHSPRSARYFRALAEKSDIAPGAISIAAMSPNVATAAGKGWHQIFVAQKPGDADLLLAVQSQAR